MSNGVSKLREIVRIQIALSLAIGMLSRLMLLDEHGAPGLEQSYSLQPEKPPRAARAYEREYFTNIAEMRDGYIKNARTKLLRFRIFAISALALSSTVPVVVTAGSPGWLVAAISAGAAITQGCQLVLRDHPLGVDSHAMAAALSRALRLYTVDTSTEAFKEFRNRVEDVLETEGENLIQTMRESHTPASPQPPSGSTIPQPQTQPKKPAARRTPEPTQTKARPRAANKTSSSSPYGDDDH